MPELNFYDKPVKTRINGWVRQWHDGPNALAFCFFKGDLSDGLLLTHEEEFDISLRGSAEDAFALAREYPPEKMRIVQEGLKKEDLLAE